MIEGDVVVEEIRLGRPPHEVFDFFVDPHKLVRWIGIGADLDPRPGGRFRFEVAPGQHCEGALSHRRTRGPPRGAAGYRRRWIR